MCGLLAEKAKSMSPFLKVLPGETVTALYKGFKTVESRLDPGKEVFRYFFEIDGREKSWDNSRMAIAFILDKANEGDIVEISNKGTLDKGDYVVKILIGQNVDADSGEAPVKKK